MNDSTPLKRCSKCDVEYPRTSEFFYADAQKNDGLRPDCKKCNNGKKQDWRENNPDKVKENSRRERQRITPERRKRLNADQLARYHANPEQASERYKKYYYGNKEYHRARGKKYRQENPDKIRETDNRCSKYPSAVAKRHRRSARKRELPDTFTASDWQRALEYFGGCCAVCGNPAGLWNTITPDHWIPLSNPDCPGTVPTNIVPLCHAKKDGQGCCNNEKHARDPMEWLIVKYGKRKAAQILKRINEYFESVKNA